MESNHEGISRRARIIAALCMVAVVAVSAIIAIRIGDQASTAAKTRETIEDGCVLVQTLHYARCGHEVTRRVAADKEYKGCTLQQMQEAFADWSITSFSPMEVVMSCNQPLFCPDHLVVMPDGAGVLGVYENVYGDGYALKAQLDIPLSDLPDELRETVHLGLGFATMQDIESWLETFES